jgi:hypothetical protein
VVRAAIVRRNEIATPRIVAALAKGFAHDSRPLTSDEHAHAWPSFSSEVWAVLDSRTFVNGINYIVP